MPGNSFPSICPGDNLIKLPSLSTNCCVAKVANAASGSFSASVKNSIRRKEAASCLPACVNLVRKEPIFEVPAERAAEKTRVGETNPDANTAASLP